MSPGGAKPLTSPSAFAFRPTGARQLVRPDEPDHWEEERSLDL